MYSKEQKKRLFNVGANFIGWAILVILFGIIWYKYYFDTDYVTTIPTVVVIYALFLYLLTKSMNGYKLNYMRLLDVGISHTIAIICSAVVGYCMICMIWHDTRDVMPLVCMVAGQVAFAWIWTWLFKHIYVRAFEPRRIIIIYGNYPAEHFIDKLGMKKDTYRVCEILDYHDGLGRVCNDILDFEGVFLYDLPADERNIIMKHCYKNNIRTYVVPKISDIIMSGAEDLHLVDTPIYLSRNIGLTMDQRIVKRCFDIIVSLFGIIIAAPLMLIIAIIIKASDGGKVLYKQERLTIGGKRFKIYKFRSMYQDAEAGGMRLAAKNDSRITPVGRILRNLHLDELPQLFNVLAGDMSIVGPRPERPEIFEKYEESVPDFDFRLKVKAGITGYAQVYGKYNTKPIDKLKLDLTYIQKFSYWMDIKLLLLTFKIVFQKESSEGVDTNQITALEEEERI